MRIGLLAGLRKKSIEGAADYYRQTRFSSLNSRMVGHYSILDG